MGIFSGEKKERARERLASGYWDTPAKACPQCDGNGYPDAACSICGVDPRRYRKFFDALPERQPPEFLLKSYQRAQRWKRYAMLYAHVAQRAALSEYWHRHAIRLGDLMNAPDT